jgi:glycosyltransferase involved in cell wall biosynthesis
MTLNDLQIKNVSSSNRNFEENRNRNSKKSNNSSNEWNIYVVMPAYNESKTIKKIIEDLKQRNLNMVIIDDGSHDKTYKIAENSVYNHGSIYRHVINRGLGAAGDAQNDDYGIQTSKNLGKRITELAKKINNIFKFEICS